MATVTIGPSGSNDTSALQSAINSAATAGNTLQLTAGTFNVAPLTLPSNANLVINSGATVYATSGYSTTQRMINVTGSNVTLAGAGAATSVFHMRKSEYTSDEQRHCLNIAGSSGSLLNNINISGCSFNDSGGDGIYIAYASHVTVSDCICNNNRRQGCSLTDQVSHITLLRCQFSNTIGTAPQAGIDIEPNPSSGGGPPEASNYVTDIQITDCTTSGNAGNGIQVQPIVLTSGAPVTVYVLRNHASGNALSDYQVQNNSPANPAGGYIVFDGCSSSNPGIYAVQAYFFASNGAPAIFRNLTVSDAHRLATGPYQSDRAAIGLMGGGGSSVALGNVHFLNTNIAITNANTDRYFNFDMDFTAPGMSTNLQFIPGTLSGGSTPIGRWNGAASGPIH